MLVSALALLASASGIQSAPTVFWAGKAGLFQTSAAKSVLGVSDVYGITKAFMGEGAGASAKYLTREGADFKASTIAIFVADHADASGVQAMLGSRSAQGSALKNLVRASQSSFVAPVTDLSSSSIPMSELLRQSKNGFSVACQGGQQTVSAIEKRERTYQGTTEATELIIVRLVDNLQLNEQCISAVSTHLSRASRGNYVGVLSYDSAPKTPAARTAAAGQRMQFHTLHVKEQSLLARKVSTFASVPGEGTVLYLNSMMLTGLLVTFLLLVFLFWGIYTMGTIHTPLRFETKEVSVAKIY